MVRNASQLEPMDPFPVLYFLEHSLPEALPGFDFIIEDHLPNDDEACAYPDGCNENPDGPFIKLTPTVYDGAWADRGRDRLTILHECGHVVLHRKVAILHRGPKGADLKAFENSEWQANQLAAELLMPPKSFVTGDSIADYCSRMGVSREAAKLRARKLAERNEITEMNWL